MRKVLKSFVSLLVIATMLLSMASVSFASNAETTGEIILSTDGIGEVTFGEQTFDGVAITVSAVIPEDDYFAGWENGKVAYDSSLFEYVGMESLTFTNLYGDDAEWEIDEVSNNEGSTEVNVAVGSYTEDSMPNNFNYEPIGMVKLYFKVVEDADTAGKTAEFTPSGDLIYYDYENINLGPEAIFGTMVTDFTSASVTFPEAISTYTITYVIDGGTVGTQTYEVGAAITALEAPAKEGFTFDGWANLPATMPAEDLTITGSYTEIPTGVETFQAGPNAVLTLDLETGAATISGTGAMSNFKASTLPWKDYKTQITSVTVSDGITHIGDHSFNGATLLTSATLAASVDTIGTYAFYSSGLTTITMPLVSTVGAYAFRSISLKTVNASGTRAEFDAMNFSSSSNNELLRAAWTVTDSEGNILRSGMHGNVRWLYDETAKKIEVFKNPTSSSSVVMDGFGNGFRSAPWYKYMSEVEEVEVHGSVSRVVSEAFRSAANLKNVIINEGVTDIWAGAFSYNAALETISLPSTLSLIGGKAFFVYLNDTKMSKITANMTFEQFSNVENQGNNMKFKRTLTDLIDCYKGWHSNQVYWTFGKEDTANDGVLTLIVDATSNQKMGSQTGGIQPWNEYADKITKIVVPDHLTYLCPSAFKNLDLVSSVTLGNNVVTIGGSAFENMDSLTEITLPRVCDTIGTYAFKDCANLETVTLSKYLTKIESSAFSGCTNIKTVNYPGTPEEFAAITISSGNGNLKNCKNIVYNYVAE